MKIKKIHIGIFVVVLVGIFLYSRRNTAILVREIPLEDKVVKRTVSASGTVTSASDANLSFSTLGNLAYLNVSEGDWVEEGTLLASLNNYAESESTQALKDSRDIALRDRDLFIENYSTNMSAVGGKDEYNLELRRLNELVSRAEATYQSQIGNLSKTYLYAPFKGKVIDIYKEVGETVLTGETVIKLADTNNILFEIKLDQEDFGYLQKGLPVEITVDSYPNEIFKGEIDTLPSYINDGTGTDFIIKIQLTGDNKDKVLMGMNGDAYIILAQTDSEVKALTFDEIYYDEEDKPYVYTLNGENAKKTPLELGLQGDIYTEIKTKLENPIIVSTNDKVVLEDNIKVKYNQSK